MVAKWSFKETKGPVTRDSVSGTEDKVEGLYKYGLGILGMGLRLDGYTMSMVRRATDDPKLSETFSVEVGWPWIHIRVIGSPSSTGIKINRRVTFSELMLTAMWVCRWRLVECGSRSHLPYNSS